MKAVVLSGIYIINIWVYCKLVFTFDQRMYKKNINWDAKGKIFSFINRFLPDTLRLQPNIILTILFCILKICMMWAELPQNGKP